jgi:hypothetical protein
MKPETTMNLTIARHMIAAEMLKLRRNRGPMTLALALSVGITILYFLALELRHHGHLGGAQGVQDGATLMGLYFGSFAAILIGAEAGTSDASSGVFGDLAATGRSRTALFLVRIPGAILVALSFTLPAFLLSVAASIAFDGPAQSPSLGFIVTSGAWVTLATSVVTTVAVGIAALTGSRSLTLTAVLGWQTIASGLIFSARFLGGTRDLLLVSALGRLRPGPPIGSHAHPGSVGALSAYELPMAAGVAILVILVWTILPTLAGTRRTATRDA